MQLLYFTGQRGQLTQETEILDSVIQKIESQVAHSSKKDLIARIDEFLAIFRQVCYLWYYICCLRTSWRNA